MQRSSNPRVHAEVEDQFPPSQEAVPNEHIRDMPQVTMPNQCMCQLSRELLGHGIALSATRLNSFELLVRSECGTSSSRFCKVFRQPCSPPGRPTSEDRGHRQSFRLSIPPQATAG